MLSKNVRYKYYSLELISTFLVRQKSLFGRQYPVGKTFHAGCPYRGVMLSGVPFLNDKKDVSTKSPHRDTLSRVDSLITESIFLAFGMTVSVGSEMTSF